MAFLHIHIHMIIVAFVWTVFMQTCAVYVVSRLGFSLTHWGLNEMTNILQTRYFNLFLIYSFVFGLKSHGSLFLASNCQEVSIGSGKGLAPKKQKSISRNIDGPFTVTYMYMRLQASMYLPTEAETKWPPFAGRHFQMHFREWKSMKSIKISLKFVPKGPIRTIPALFQIMAWRRPGDKPLSEPMMAHFIDAYMRHQSSLY